MRRKQAAILCHLRFYVVLITALTLSFLASTETAEIEGSEFIPSYALTVTTAESLHDAFLNPNVSAIYLGQDITLNRVSWETGSKMDPESGIVLRRNLTLTTHPSLTTPAILYLDYMVNRVLAGKNIVLTINGVVLTGVSDDAQNFFFVPFFQFEQDGAIFIENSQFQLAIEPQSLWPLEDYPDKMNSTARPEGYDWPVEAIVVSKTECEKNALREVSCKDGAIWVGSLASRLTVFDQNLQPLGKAAFLVKNVLMIAQTMRKKTSRSIRKDVSTEDEFKKALQSPDVERIQIVKDLNLTADLFPQSIRTPITRNLTILSDPQLNRSAIISFNYLRGAIVAGNGVEIKLENLNFTHVSKDPIDFELVPFFSLQPGAIYVYRNVVSEMALSPDDVLPLNQLPYALYGGEVPSKYENVTNDVKVVSSKWCEKDGRVQCPDGAIWIRHGIRRLKVLDAYNQEVLGEGFMNSENTLVKIVDIHGTDKDFDPLSASETDDDHKTDKAPVDEERKGFGFIEGFDPWLLTYAVIGAAILMCIVCFVVPFVRRRRAKKKLGQKSQTIKSEGSMGDEDDGINAHQKVARQLLGDVKLGSLLGCGSFGRVYKAMWSGAQVAVKVILHQEDEAEVEQEAQFSISLRHPNVVQTFHYGVRTVDNATPTPKHAREKCSVVDIECSASNSKDPVQNGMSIPSSWMQSSNGGKAFGTFTTASAESTAIPTEEQSHEDFAEERWMEMWLIQEYCNLGSLGKQNYLRVNDQHSAWGSKHPPLQVIVDTCKDIARGMKYLHDNGIVHGDLKCDNLLLQSCQVNAKSFIAKVADFGLSRKLGPSTHLSTKSFGTITHMPPELLLDGHLSSKVDVYSFGVIMWELMTGLTPFRNLRYAEVMRAIVVDDRRPIFPPETEEGYVLLAKRCWDRDPSKRPSFEDVLSELDQMTTLATVGSTSSSSWDSESDASENKVYSA